MHRPDTVAEVLELRVAGLGARRIAKRTGLPVATVSQHGPGMKHERRIALTGWQQRLVDQWPDQLVRGLIHSDGCRFINTGRSSWVCPRYGFSQKSDDIRGIFCDTCDRLGGHWTRAGDRTIYVSRRADVAFLDEFIGPKR